MSRCIMVVGTHRGGTSCVAGVLHHLGATSPHGARPGRGNPKGHFEDPGFVGWNQAQIGPHMARPDLKPLKENRRKDYLRRIGERREQYRVWTLKDPRLCFVAQQIAPLFAEAGVELRVVIVHRDPKCSADSLGERDAMDDDRTKMATVAYFDARDRFAASWDGPLLHLKYEDLMTNTEAVVAEMAAFAFEGLEPPDVYAVQNAVAHVDPNLWHKR